MAPKTQQAWRLARQQHGAITRRQLLALGFSRDAIAHRLATGRLHAMHRGVYAVGRPQLGQRGIWMAAVLSCGSKAALSHSSAGVLWGIVMTEDLVEVSAPPSSRPRRGITLHRRTTFDITRHYGIPVTTPVTTLIDLATRLPAHRLERAVNEADRLDLVDPETLRKALGRLGRQPGTATLRRLLDRRTFTLTDSELERRFLLLVRGAGLPQPRTGCRVNGYKVDFYWPDLGLVVETDGLRYHRTPAQQAHDRRRDQAHAAAGVTTLRFTHAQITFEPDHVRDTLSAVARRLRDTASHADPLRMGSAG
jgi:very-short-patch-repair endonuclease